MSPNRKPIKGLQDSRIILLKCLFYYLKVCGVAPINFDFKLMNCGKVRRWVFKSSRQNLFYNLFLICGVVVANYYSLLMILDKSFRYGTHYIYMQVISMTCTTLILMKNCSKNNKLPDILNEMIVTKERIKNSHADRLTRRLTKQICLTFSASSLLWLAINLTICIYPDGSFRFQPLLLSTSITVQNALAVQYIIILMFFKRLLKMINDRLENLSRNATATDKTGSKAVDSNVEIHTFLRLRDSFSSMCKISQQLSTYYSFFLLLFLISKFVTFTIQLYFLVEIILKNEVIQAIIPFSICTFYSIDCAFFMVLLAALVSQISIERGRTCEIIDNYLDNSLSPVMKEKLQQLFIYLLHDNMKFAIFDLFSLNGSLLVSIGGSITTYLVILLQFNG